MERAAGPDYLGRSVLVSPEQPAPGPWEQCPRLTVETGSPDPATGRRLRSAWYNRERLVIEVDGPLPHPEPTLEAPWWTLQPGTTLGEEVWHHLLTANAVDARDPDRLRFAPRDRALEAGARPPAADQPGDVAIEDGSAWCDGGPLDSFGRSELRGAALIPAANLSVGRLSALHPCEPTADLAPDQHRAVGHLGGGACIVAPAGSGKTRVLTERARWLVRDLGVEPSAVCLVAYNVRARAEMQERTADLDGMEVRTLNSLALAVCNGTGPFTRPAHHGRVDVIGERDVRDLLHNLVGERAPRRRRKAMTDPLAAWLEALSASRLGLRDPTEVEHDYAPDVAGFAELAPAYAEALDERGAVDFDHQIVRAIDVLLSDPAARAAARRACGVLLVDEFQDLTPAHLLMIRLLAGPRADVFGVGDDDQTIYGYSGASPEWLIDYHKFFPGAQRHELHVNYRCPPEVVDAASNLLSHNRRRIDKQITAAPGRKSSIGGDPAARPSNDAGSIMAVETAPAGAPVLRRAVEALLSAGTQPDDIAVLTRVNSTLLVPQIVLGDMGVPSAQPVGRGFLERTGVAAALAWLDIATAPERGLPSRALSDAARRPPRGISPRVIEWIAEQQSISEIKALAGRIKDERSSKKVGELADDIAMLRSKMKQADGELTTRSLLETVRDDLGLGGSLDTRLDASRRSVDRSAHGDDLRALISVAHLHPDPTDFRRWLSDRLSDGYQSDGGHGVQLATVHRVKGREWPHVIVYEASKGLMPHRLSGDLEEERRVFHVALTRCSESVTLICGDPPTDFQAELTTRYQPPSEPDPDTTTGLLTPPVVVGTSAPPTPASASKSPGRPKPQPPTDPEGAAAYEALKAWRLQRSRADNVPAYIVFNNATLIELATRRPTTDAELRAVPGIGPAKLTAYGDEIKGILRSDPESSG